MYQRLSIQIVYPLDRILSGYVKFLHLCHEIGIDAVLDCLSGVIQQLAKLLVRSHFALINPRPHVFPEPQQLLSCRCLA
jgi:hypothetical protein